MTTIRFKLPRRLTAPRTEYTWPTAKHPARSWSDDDKDLLRQMQQAAREQDTYWYAISFCRLNHLTD